jgi:adenosylcobinamide-phosphate synthase
MSAPAVLLIALAIDVILGDPPRLYRLMPHPVAAIGKLIAALERRWNDLDRADSSRVRRGIVLAVLMTGLALGFGWAAAFGLDLLDWGWIVEAALVSSLIAFRGLDDHVRAVAVGLDAGLDAGRAAVGHVVGRDPDSLDRAGVARAAIESLAENFADGTVAPVFWFLVLGLPGLFAYKAINTMDSMIGHTSPRYAAFGRAAARLDDVVNWIPARLAAVLVTMAALINPGAHGRGAWRCALRDAPRHRSPNAGWPEAALAGALGLAIAGPRRYGGQMVADAWMGDGDSRATAGDIRRALRLYRTAGAGLAALLAGGLVL